MARVLRVVLLVLCVRGAAFSKAACEIELQCAECLPEYMPLVAGPAPLVAGPAPRAGLLRAAHGQPLRLHCGANGRFLNYPLNQSLAVECHEGQYRVEGLLRHLLDLGCQEDVFEDVLQPVEECYPPLQGRVYQAAAGEGTGGAGGGMRPVAVVCYDEQRAVPVRASLVPASTLPLRGRTGASARSLFGNLNQMFDSRLRTDGARLFADDSRLTRRFRELTKHDHFSLADQHLTSIELLPPEYFEDQLARVANFVSNKVAVWSSVATGNVRHVREDVSRAMARGTLRVHVGTSGTLSTARDTQIYLAGSRFPVAEYLWTVVVEPATGRGAALVTLGDPFVAVSRVRGAVRCASRCAELGWLAATRRARRYETPLYGLTFCCDLHSFAAAFPEMPGALVADIKRGTDGLLTDITDT